MKKIILKEVKTPVVACLQCYGCVIDHKKPIPVKISVPKAKLVKHI